MLKDVFNSTTGTQIHQKKLAASLSVYIMTGGKPYLTAPVVDLVGVVVSGVHQFVGGVAEAGESLVLSEQRALQLPVALQQSLHPIQGVLRREVQDDI